MHVRHRPGALGLACLLPILATGTVRGERPMSPPAQTSTASADALKPLAFMIGRWEGTSAGQPGSAQVQREYVRVLNSRFIRVQNRSVYQPQEKNPTRAPEARAGVTGEADDAADAQRGIRRSTVG